MALWHRRYVEALEAMPGYEAVARNLHQVPFRPARTFWEAVQSVWFCFAFLRLTGCRKAQPAGCSGGRKSGARPEK